MITNLRWIERRLGHHWMADGIQYLVVGGVMILWGTLMLIGYRTYIGSTYLAFWLVVPIILASSAWWQRALISRLKDRISVPRTGYVEFRPPDKRFRVAVWVVTGAFALVLGSLIVIGLRREIIASGVHPHFRLVNRAGADDPLLTGSKSGPDLRFLRESITFLSWTQIGCGLVVMTRGWVTLRRFLQDHPLIEGPPGPQKDDSAT